MSRRTCSLAASAAISVVCAAAASATPLDAESFVAAFAEVCVPQRLSYQGTQAEAEQAGWAAVRSKSHPELAAMMEKSEAATHDPEFPMHFEYRAYRKALGETELHLVLSRAASEPVEDLGAFTEIGCYLYDFEATAMIDAAPVTALIGNPISQSMQTNELSGHVWGPPPAMPRTLDTYLTFIPEGSPHVAMSGFSGLVLKFSTSEPEAK